MSLCGLAVAVIVALIRDNGAAFFFPSIWRSDLPSSLTPALHDSAQRITPRTTQAW
jgi:hypothetical protein